MTNSVDNVFEAYQKLLSMIDRDSRFNEEQKFYLKNQVIYTPDVGKSLKEAITQGYIDDVLEILASTIVNWLRKLENFVLKSTLLTMKKINQLNFSRY